MRETAANNVFLVPLILYDWLRKIVRWRLLLLLVDQVDVVFDSLYVHLFGHNGVAHLTCSFLVVHFHFLGVCLVQLAFTILLLDHL